jgi:hypothetical protein
MFRPFVITLAGAGLVAGAAAAAEPIVGATLGTDSARIATALSAEGYGIARYERLPDGISVAAVKEDRRLELALDPATGAVIGLSEYARSGPERPGVDDAAVHAMLAEQGYTVTSYERKRGKIEVYATKDGRRWELKIDPRSGRIREAEEEG